MPQHPRTPIEQIGDQLLAVRQRLSDDGLTRPEREREEIRLEALMAMIQPCKPLERR